MIVDDLIPIKGAFGIRYHVDPDPEQFIIPGDIFRDLFIPCPEISPSKIGWRSRLSSFFAALAFWREKPRKETQ